MKTVEETRQLYRYLLVGGFNTVLGYGLYSLMNYMLSSWIAYGYLVAVVLSNAIAITLATLGYKFLVFRTVGSFWSEYLRVWVVYSIAFAANLVLLPVLVELLNMNAYVAQFLLTGVTVSASFVGNKYFSFRSGPNTFL